MEALGFDVAKCDIKSACFFVISINKKGMSSTTTLPDEIVLNKIYLIRKQKVMLDSDLAELYCVETRVLNQAVSRNPDRIPEDFMFRLEPVEWELLISQFVISKKQFAENRGGRRKLPNVFTEHGVLMLSSVLKSSRAITVNIQVMRIFTRIREMLADNTDLRLDIERIKRKLDKHGKSIDEVFMYLDKLIEKKTNPEPRKRIGYKSDQL